MGLITNVVNAAINRQTQLEVAEKMAQNRSEIADKTNATNVSINEATNEVGMDKVQRTIESQEHLDALNRRNKLLIGLGSGLVALTSAGISAYGRIKAASIKNDRNNNDRNQGNGGTGGVKSNPSSTKIETPKTPGFTESLKNNWWKTFVPQNSYYTQSPFSSGSGAVYVPSTLNMVTTPLLTIL